MSSESWVRPADDHPFPPGRRLDLHLHLLDRQVIDPDGRLLCNVDDVDLDVGDDGRLTVSRLLIGPLALGPRLGGRLGRWWAAIASRLSTGEHSRPHEIDIADVIDFGSSITVTRAAAERIVTACSPLETWLDEYVISRIPGSRHESE